MKNRIVIVLTLCAMLFACKSPSKLVEEGNYDKAIERSIKKMLKGNAKTDDKTMLDKAYRLANLQDEERIKLLKIEGKPENWEKIYYVYNRLDLRQKEVRKVLPFEIKGVNYNYKQIDYANQIIEAKINAAEYFYAYGNKLMQAGTKYSYREAYNSYLKAKNYRESAYPDINQLIANTRYLGTTRVLVDVSNSAEFQFPPDFYDRLLSLNTSSLSNFWVDYHLGRSDRTTEFDYMVTIQLLGVIRSPEQYIKTEYQRTKRVQDGYHYILDSRGNVKKDSLGNDIKEPKYRDLICKVLKTDQTKQITIEAQVEYLQLIPRKLNKLEQIAASSIFEHTSAKAIGEINALLPEDLRLIEIDPVPFPNDISMIYDCLTPLKKTFQDVLNTNKNMIR